MANTSLTFLNRFTTLPFVIDLLTRKQLTLLDPAFWEDYNDRVTMELYRKKRNSQSIYALCLSDERETIHHWNSFAGGMNGCCIEFNAKKLFECLDQVAGITHGKSRYIKVGDLKKLAAENEHLPYLKREPFQPESEYRIIALSNQPQQASFDIPIHTNVIRRITLSNHLPKTVFESLKEGIHKIAPDYEGRISHSTLFNNAQWINHFSKYKG
jgi:hypothetical protein